MLLHKRAAQQGHRFIEHGLCSSIVALQVERFGQVAMRECVRSVLMSSAPSTRQRLAKLHGCSREGLILVQSAHNAIVFSNTAISLSSPAARAPSILDCSCRTSFACQHAASAACMG
jgi:hypothetical protein